MLRTKVLPSFCLLTLLLGCTDPLVDPEQPDATPAFPDGGPRDATVDAAFDATQDGGIECNYIPDTECPADVPYPGTPCEGELSCNEYPTLRGFEGSWRVECSEGTWRIGEFPTNANPPHAEQPLPSAERCREPFTGDRTGVSLNVGPPGVDDFRSFADGDRVYLSRGGQGSYMVEFRIDAAGARDLDCLLLDVTVTIDGREAGLLSIPARFHCGQTRKVYVVVQPPPPDPEASARGVREQEHALELRVSLPGMAEVTRELILMHPTEPVVG